MKLAAAQQLAAEFVREISTACERIEVVGSVRRERPECNDIDIVLIPLYETVPDGMFDKKLVSLLDAALDRLVIDGRILMELDGPLLKRGYFPNKGHLLKGGKFAFDLYVSTPERWATLLLIRTGSAEHNKHLCRHALSLGMKLHASGEGVRDTEKNLIQCNSEADVFGALGLRYVTPKERER